MLVQPLMAGLGQHIKTTVDIASYLVNQRRVDDDFRRRSTELRDSPSLGVIRLDYESNLNAHLLDYDYPATPGDIDCVDSFDYDVIYRVVPGLTFEMCMSGRMTQEVEAEFIEAVEWLDKKGVSAITGDCGFMLNFQNLARKYTCRPVFMSSLSVLPAISSSFNAKTIIAIFTANKPLLKMMEPLILERCRVNTQASNFIIIGCDEVPGYDAAAKGGRVDDKEVEHGIIKLAFKTLEDYPKLRGFLFECPKLPRYSDAVREATGLPVYDAITCSDFFISSFRDNVRFGLNNWQKTWSGLGEQKIGKDLEKNEAKKLVLRPK